MKDYFTGSIIQHQERAKRLLERIPPNLPREFHVLVQKCNDELSRLLDGLKFLLEDPRMQMIEYQPERLRRFRRIVDQMGLLETTAIAALERHNCDDLFLNRFIETIKQETQYPLLPPVVTSLSQQYFHIFPNLNLLFVPLSEGDFLLHLPDLYHEIAHPLVTERYNRRVKPFQDAISNALDIVLEYVEEEQQKEERRRGPQKLFFYFYLWEKSWLEWTTEFFCDIFAICTIGPAFAWSHIYLCAKYGQDPFIVPTAHLVSHPADAARMKSMLFALELLGFNEDVGKIQQKWDELIIISDAKPEPEYKRCFPDHILQKITTTAVNGVNGLGCQVASLNSNGQIYCLLNNAWKMFWGDPQQYITWERNSIHNLRNQIYPNN
ncbi:MAG: hypothetical protein ROW48_10500 [Bellilinea sp.]